METTHTPINRTCPACLGELRLTDSGNKLFHAGDRPETCPVLIDVDYTSTLTDADVEAIELHHTTAGLQPTIPNHSRAADPTATRFRRLHDLLAEIEMLYGLAPREAIVEVRDMAELGLLDGGQ